MIITWYGEGSYKCQSGDIVLLSDPFESSTGLTPPRMKANIVLRTLTKIPFVADSEESMTIQNAGEYDRFGIEVKGFSLRRESTETFLKTFYLVDFDGIRFCFLGHISEPLEAIDLEPLEGVDVLFIPGGGAPFLGQEQAVKLIHQIEPKVVIPSFFKVPGLKRATADVSVFMKEFGKKTEPQEKFTFKKKELNVSGTDLVILTL